MKAAALGLFSILVAACSDRAAGTPDMTNESRVSDLPYLNRNGTTFPYVRYETRHSDAGQRHGRAFFLYPMMDDRSNLLVLDYVPELQNFEALFSEDMIGTSGAITVLNRTLRIQSLPISIPSGPTTMSEWAMEYAGRNFVCGRDQNSDVEASFEVSCAAPGYKLNLTFDAERGVTQFQDFCGSAICTYHLVDSLGVLSPELLNYMRVLVR